jgi:hypothetical protein
VDPTRALRREDLDDPSVEGDECARTVHFDHRSIVGRPQLSRNAD